MSVQRPADANPSPPAPARQAHIVGRILVRDPLVAIGGTEGRHLPLGPAPLLSPILGARAACFLVQLRWTIETRWRAERLIEAWRRQREAYPHHRVVVLANTAREDVILQDAGVSSILAHQNMFVSETTFAPDRSIPKTFDAVYNARLAPYKRHHLGAGISSLALIHAALNPHEHAHAESLRRLMPQATFANAVETAAALAGMTGARAAAARRLAPIHGDIRMAPGRVAHWINRARVGLCLSAEEGAMQASVEYLLCGLPIVSTVSLGGRERYFDPAFCRIVPDDPQAVADAVSDLAAARVDPQAVRAATLARLVHDRRAFVDLVDAITVDLGGAGGFADQLPALLGEPILAPRPIGDLLAEVAATHPAVR